MLLSPLDPKSSVTSNILIVNSPATVSRRAGKSRALPNPPRIVYVGSLRRWVNLKTKTDKYPESGTIQVSDSCNAFRITCLGSVPWRLELRVSCVRDARRGAFTRFVLSKARLSMSGQLIAAAPCQGGCSGRDMKVTTLSVAYPPIGLLPGDSSRAGCPVRKV